MDSSLREVIQLYQAQVELTDKIWGYFATVSLGVLGFAIGSEHAAKSRRSMSALAIGYIIFTIGNSCSLFESQSDLRGLGTVLANAAKLNNVGVLQGRFEGLPVGWVLGFQLSLALAVVVVLGWLAVQAGRKASEATANATKSPDSSR